MSLDFYQLLFWDESVPTEFKEIFNQANEVSNSQSRKHSSTLEESLIVDEDYEIIGKSQNEQSVCPLCYRVVTSGNTQLYSNHLQSYFDAHTVCAMECKQKTAKLASLHNITRATQMDRLPLEHDLRDLDVKCFVELRIYHPIAQQSYLSKTTSTYLRSKKHLGQQSVVQIDYANIKELFGQREALHIPFQEARIQIDLTIIDANLMQESKANKSWEFFYEIKGKEYVCVNSNGAYLSFENENNKAHNLKYLMITLPDLNIAKQSPKQSPISDSFLFSPKMNVKQYTPQVQPAIVQPRVRFQSFQLEEQATAEEWTEDLQNFDQIRGNIVNFVKTQQGSRLIQKYFTTCTQIELDQLLQEIGPNIGELMIDPYANYMFGSLSQSCAPNQRLFILQTISTHLVEIACDKKGTHAIQSLVSLISSKQEEEMVENSIRNHIITLTLDSQGTHLIKKIIARFSEDRLNVLFYKLMEKFILVVNHQFGLCVLKDLISKFKNNSEKYNVILNRMRDQLDEIVQDPFGNYAIQHVIDIYGDSKCLLIIDRILQKLVQLSIHKYSSNVVEKCILETTPKTQKRFIKQLAQESICLELMKNKFGTFVLQKALQEAEKLGENDLLQNTLQRCLPSIYAQNIRQKWVEYLSKK